MSTAVSSAASANRPRPSSSTRRGSSRRSTNRTPIRSRGSPTGARSIGSSRPAWHTRRAPRAAIGVVVLDLDRLKEMNDTYGHEAGDRALRAIGSVLKATVRQNDLCARFAGDEFVVVLWDCPPEHEARRVAGAAERGCGVSVRATTRRPPLAVDQCGPGALPERRADVRRAARGCRRADVSRQGGAPLAQHAAPGQRAEFNLSAGCWPLAAGRRKTQNNTEQHRAVCSYANFSCCVLLCSSVAL